MEGTSRFNLEDTKTWDKQKEKVDERLKDSLLRQLSFGNMSVKGLITMGSST
jgi:hypothetical protein